MHYQDDPNDPDWKVSKLKSDAGTVKEHHSGSKPKYSQKFCEKWLNVFSPWLTRCEDDPHKPFCRACQCRLDCNRCHLQRHERTSKHARNLEILVNKGEGAARQNLSIRQERSKYYQQRKKCGSSMGSHEDSEMGMEDYIVEAEPETEYGYEPTDLTSEDQYTQEDSNADTITEEVVEQMMAARATPQKNSVGRPRKIVKQQPQIIEEDSNMVEEITDRKEGIKLLMQIQKDKSELMDSFKELMGGNMPQPSPPREKNHVDLFFESVSSSVKALSPKLVAEAKMRVSQLICELELRALNDESLNNHHQHQQATSTTVVVSPEPTSGSYIINQSVGIATDGQHHHHHHQDHGEEVQHYEALS